jgi:hypothetical protein
MGLAGHETRVGIVEKRLRNLYRNFVERPNLVQIGVSKIILLKRVLYRIRGRVLDSFNSGQGPGKGCCEYSSGHLAFIKGGFILNHLSAYQALIKASSLRLTSRWNCHHSVWRNNIFSWSYLAYCLYKNDVLRK